MFFHIFKNKVVVNWNVGWLNNNSQNQTWVQLINRALSKTSQISPHPFLQLCLKNTKILFVYFVTHNFLNVNFGQMALRYFDWYLYLFFGWKNIWVPSSNLISKSGLWNFISINILKKQLKKGYNNKWIFFALTLLYI